MGSIIYEKKGHTALITLNRKETLNALCEKFIAEINETLDLAGSDPDIYTIIITGSGKSFIAGADISEMYEKNEISIKPWAALACDLCMRIENMDKPVIAAINGYALGGGLELAMACDIRLASENAKMGLTETGLGVICGSGGTQRLPRLIGTGAAKEMIYTAKMIDAQTAKELRLVNRVLPRDSLLDEALTLCREIEKNGQLAVRAAKRSINASDHMSIQNGCLFERENFSALFAKEDQKTGMGAFLEKKKEIHFKNR